MFGFAAAIPDRSVQLSSELPNELSAASLPAYQFKPDSRSTRKNFAAQTNLAWSIVSSANVFSTEDNTIEAITCPSASDCWAVGNGGFPNFSPSFIEHWNGISWSIVPSPNSGYSSRFHGVTCASASDCWAVGDNFPYNAVQTLIEHWNGSSWAVVTSPNTSATEWNSLNHVTCASASDCWAVGYYYPGNTGNEIRTLIERWNGISWSIVASNDNGNQSRLNDVACASASECWAVGTLIEHWNGSSWAIATTPSNSGFLQGVTCNSASDCWAVGYYYAGGITHPLIEHWDGSAWSIIGSPSAGNGDQLSSVTCASATNCWAAGYYYLGSVTQTLIEHWDGSAWAVVTSANYYFHVTNHLYGISCGSSSDCWAVGDYQYSRGQTLVEHWDGTSWAIVTSPNTGGTTTNDLNGVTCASGSECWAVGSYINDGDRGPMIERWDGTAWSVASTSGALSQFSPLSSVACASPSECWGVGYSEYYDPINHRYYVSTMIQHWNGASWATIDSPNAAALNYINGVTCASASECWAVGYSDSDNIPGDHHRTLIEQWDGTAWAAITSRNSGSAQNSILRGVTCASTSDCWAVGNDRTGSDSHTLIEHWNGNSWVIVPAPNPSSQFNVLNGVSCASGSDCWAAGYYASGSGAIQTLIEHWNGSSWIVVTSPNIGPKSNQLLSVSCVSGADCWVVGNYVSSAHVAQTLAEHWNGATWSVVPSANTSGTQENKLNSVTCLSAADCWAVGHYTNSSGITQTLIERWTSSVQLVSAVSRKAHGDAGTFDINLPVAGNAGIECRSGGPGGDYQVTATFGVPIVTAAASIVSGIGNVSGSSVRGSQVTINLSGVTNGQTVVVRLSNVSDGSNSTGFDIPVGILFGDTTGDGAVNASDISQTKMQSGQSVSGSNLREDVLTNGVINSSDLTAVKAASGTTLP
jgi:hypothetical protein